MIADGWRSVIERPGRSAAQAVAVALAVGCGVATIGLAATGAGAIDDQRNLLRATTMVVVPVRKGDVVRPLSELDAEKVGRLPGVTGAALVTTSTRPIAVREGRFTGVERSMKVTTLPASALVMLGVALRDARASVDDVGDRGSAILGAIAADDLGVESASVDHPALLVIDGRLVEVVGIARSFARRPDLARHVLIVGRATDEPEPAGVGSSEAVEQSLELSIAPGAAGPLSREIPVTISPEAPDDVLANSVPELAELGEAMSKTTRSVMVTLGLVAGGLAATAIASSTNAQVIRRRPEFALRRVFGASGGNIATLVAVETTIVCVGGGLLGAWMGSVLVAGVALIKGWVPDMSPLVPVGGVVIGSAIGLLAAAWPALRAMSIEPRAALAAD